MTIEHQFNMLVREIRKECVGNGPREITTRFVGPWAISEMKGNLTNIEKFMIESKKGHQVVHEARTTLVKEIYNDIEKVKKLEDLVQAKLVSIFADINIDSDIAMTIYVFDKPIIVNRENKN
ncbi:uncharacterized protein YbcI [Cytobacillus horneckiae]|uniref:DUF2294 domain-containing protein n=1 Tax=Cytobacillus horneckiae TaxID=549687 RepID=A0A2N0ZL52_9BACI|nr:DUF2294 domain-containing protein [Cytobacillus horneckiae]MBN6885631.1 DUF2294 domain-containing protein [Cytobacillus horneckiae]MEC1156258.1 DUF2294 domain-containing protein [Cytobacillus horneckiae]MED2938276.1 DUF2294 domain-containing protein [Cytobacillus horneckiae]PKG30206.1 DUF2294 domain-containing protein [Cytobacillus horneckiae]